MTRRVLIFVAIQMEANAIARALGLAFAKDRLSAAGQVRDLLVELRVVGMRAVRLPQTIDRTDLVLVISAGLAGALDPTLRCGDVVVDSPEAPGQIVSSDSPLTTPALKAELFAQTGARAVDMETDRVRGLAVSVNVPCLAVRAISDTASESIDPVVMGLVDEMGRVKVAKIVPAFARRPSLMRELLHLRASSVCALESVSNHLLRFLQSM